MPIRETVQALVAAGAVLAATLAGADPAPFDLVGPSLEARVTRAGVTLPITKVPNLAVGDRLLIKAHLPESQSVHYLMVAAFLRGPTNPPPPNWFYRCDTWTETCANRGLALAVPKDAQQLLIFFAPETGGDYSTLVNAVRGRPGAFVRASQQLAQAALDHVRLERYLDGVRTVGRTEPDKLKSVAPLLARSLAIKVDEKCLDRIPALQSPCLMQGQDALILSDGHSASMVATLTSGPASDLALQAGSTALQGAYSSFIGSILDIGRLLDSFHTAHYQYIPALTSERDERLALLLNTPPSFHDPKSVLVVALPSIEPPQLPPLHAVDPKAAYCARRDPLTVPVEGAPLVFATSFAHDLTLTVQDGDGKSIALPVHADAARGGLVVTGDRLGTVGRVDEHIRAAIHGFWGFDRFDGPLVELLNPQTEPWTMEAADQASLIVGRENLVRLRSASVACLAEVRMRDAAGHESSIAWKATSAQDVEVTLPLQAVPPGPVVLEFRQFGASETQAVDLTAYADLGHLDRFSIHAGDLAGVLKGRRLDQVERLKLNDVEFLPSDPTPATDAEELPLTATDPARVAAWRPGETGKSTIVLKDGRSMRLDVVVLPTRPRGRLIAKSVRPAAGGEAAPIELASAEELPLDATLTFSVRTESPARYAHDEAIEVATVDGTFSTLLSLGNGGLTLQDSKVALATLEPSKAFGPSAFGALQYRLVSGDAAGDWQPLMTLVRVPVLTRLDCPATRTGSCQLVGAKLFLVEAVSTEARFRNPVRVPDGFPGFSLSVPRPADGRLFLRLRDDPAVVSKVVFPAVDEPAAEAPRKATDSPAPAADEAAARALRAEPPK